MRHPAVFDASVLVRAAVDEQPSARHWTSRAESGEIAVLAPGLIWAEVVHAFVRYVRGGNLSAESAHERLVWLLQLPIRSEPIESLGLAALPRALSSGGSGYDAHYLVLVEAADATLVTADRRLAEAATRAELIA
jgi:predicted nucleic acid-binding protein